MPYHTGGGGGSRNNRGMGSRRTASGTRRTTRTTNPMRRTTQTTRGQRSSMGRVGGGRTNRNRSRVTSRPVSGTPTPINRPIIRSSARRRGATVSNQKPSTPNNSGNYVSGLTAISGQFINERTGQPYRGPYHIHAESGRPMVGARHSSTRHDYLIRTTDYSNGTMGPNDPDVPPMSGGGGGRKTPMSQGLCIEGTNQRYFGNYVDSGGQYFSTKTGVVEGTSQVLGPCK